MQVRHPLRLPSSLLGPPCLQPWSHRLSKGPFQVASIRFPVIAMIHSDRCSSLQASTSPSEAGGGYSGRGHGSHLSISDPSHHVTEAIGHMYDDDYDNRRDSKRLSYIPSMGESISTIPPSLAGSESPSSPQSIQVQNHLNELNHRNPNGPSRSSIENGSPDRDSSSPPSSPGQSSPDTATTSFPLNDVNYESDPAAITQELSNLAAIRRMSMDVAATGDPDLPSFGPNLNMPSASPSPTDDENDASRLFWVPARLHPELAPKEFKSFLESRADHIKRTSGDFSSLGPERAGSEGGLRRKKSMLSRQIDNSNEFTDGAERLERKRSHARSSLGPNLHELENLVDDSKHPNSDPTPVVDGLQKLGLGSDEDKPILPPAPPGASLRRSTRTQYKKGSFRKGEKLPYSRRMARTSEGSEKTPSIVTSSGEKPILGLTRVSTDPTPGARREQSRSDSTRSAADSSKPTTDTTPDSNLDQPSTKSESQSSTAKRVSPPRQWHSRISSNGRSTLTIPPSEQKIPEIVETPPPETKRVPSGSNTQPSNAQEHEPRSDSRQPPTKVSSRQEPTSNKRTYPPRQTSKEGPPTLNEFASSPQRLPGNTTRTDSLSFIPTMSPGTEERKPEKKPKDKKESEGGRKSSWHWLLGTEDKDKDKEKKKDKDSDTKKLKSKLVDKVHDNARLDILQSSTDSQNQDSKLEEERRKDNVRRASGETKKEKESGLFSSIFGGGKRKHSGDSHHKKNLSRNLSPDPPVRELQPDIDYPWTRFSILEERAIYRMAHIKLANPRRALHSQVLLSNFMYSYLAKVQQMQPQMMAASQGHQNSQDQADEYLEYQRYQEVSDFVSFMRCL